ncbi:ribosome biogenesis protein ERB1 [Kwoniella bestiolae CBS 10118]|uniref:Ribosome biogenesis protein ERB1 n=1 Tax=Kwoniella bestiolae CBS 10118 TaxID=1296100 RepID=A0A1B9FRL6_9TREE|nr:ribosome biogenesis protein ERB1 [Kwoniella bestiolae CBS 10118]OCF21417.1 ribosome biogenesis protein ERB1 [Kwoniella bestiolae CBS 10118]
MAPRNATASSSRAASSSVSRLAKTNGNAGPSTLKNKKRAVQEVSEDEDEEFGSAGSGIDMSEDEDGEEGEDDEEEEAFPEFDSEIEDGDAEEEDGDDETGLDEEELDDEESGSESGYNSSDIEAMYAEGDEDEEEEYSPITSPSSSHKDLSTDEKLSKLIAKNSIKPDESLGTDAKISRAKEGVGRLVPSKLVEGGYKREYEDYEAGYGSESSTEDNPNTVGNIPMEWYDDMPHIGYDVNGRKIFRPAQGDELDKFLSNTEDPAAWTSAEDKLLQQSVQLSDKELDIIRRLERAENPDADYDPYQPTIEWFTGEGNERVMPLSAAPEPKRRFVPSKWEHKKIMKIVKAIREGRIIPNKPSAAKPTVYSIWSESDQANLSHAMYMPAPQLPPPKTIESYNPPEEYLLNEEEQKQWEEADKEDRKTDFLPAKYDSLRLVPGYKNLVQERFERCLDLYLAPRTRKVKLNIDPESLIPKLPAPKELKPFPISTSVVYRHPESSRVRSVSTSPDGLWVATGSEDGIVRVWDLGNGREVWKWNLKGGAIQHLSFSPYKDECLLIALVSGKIAVLSPLALVAPAIAANTLTHVNTAFATSAATTKIGAGKEIKGVESIKWVRPSESERERGVLVYVEVPGTPKQVSWHRKGDYFATVASDASNKSVLIHQLSKHSTQSPFKKLPGQVQKVIFHPSKPHFFVATQRYIRQYDLATQTLVRTLQSGVKWISSLDLHPRGDNLIIGSYDKKLAWFDLDLSNKPYKTLRYHTKALRSVVYHPTLPLFASASDDGTIHIFHCTIYQDLMQNPLIVPLKILRGHKVTDGIGVLDLSWVSGKPWLVSSGSDGEVRLWCS